MGMVKRSVTIKIGDIFGLLVKVYEYISKTLRKHYKPCPPGIEEVEFLTQRKIWALNCYGTKKLEISPDLSSVGA